MYDTNKSENETNQDYDERPLSATDFSTFRYRNEEKIESEIDSNRKEKFLPVVQKKLHFWERIKLFLQSLKKGSYFEPFIEYKSIRFIYRITNAICIAQGETEDVIKEDQEQLEKEQPVSFKSSSFLYVPSDFEYKTQKFVRPKINNPKNELKIYKVDDSLNLTIDSQKTVEQKIKIEQSDQKEVFENDKNEYYIKEEK